MIILPVKRDVRSCLNFFLSKPAVHFTHWAHCSLFRFRINFWNYETIQTFW